MCGKNHDLTNAISLLKMGVISLNLRPTLVTYNTLLAAIAETQHLPALEVDGVRTTPSERCALARDVLAELRYERLTAEIIVFVGMGLGS